jgi:hypothetical protein
MVLVFVIVNFVVEQLVSITITSIIRRMVVVLSFIKTILL